MKTVSCDLTLKEFVFKLVEAWSFLVARVIKNMSRRKPFELKRPEVLFIDKMNKFCPSAVCNKLLTNLDCSRRTGEYWPSVVLYGPRCAPHCNYRQNNNSKCWEN